MEYEKESDIEWQMESHFWLSVKILEMTEFVT